MSKVRLTGGDDHVFEDGMSFKNLRDAMVAAATAGMWHIAHELAQRYGVQDLICVKCGQQTGAQHTYYSYRDRAIRICLKCNSGAIVLR